MRVSLRAIMVVIAATLGFANFAVAQPPDAVSAGAKAMAKAEYTEARQWYLLAADQGNPIAQASLGYIYEHGLGVARDDAEAVRWYQLAANQGLATAQFNLGLKYSKGESVPLDLIEAYKWCNLAASQGDTEAAKRRDVLAADMTKQQIAEAQRRSADWKPARQPANPESAPEITTAKANVSSTTAGSGFFVTPAGLFVTSMQVIEGCSTLSLPGGARLEIVNADPTLGLALLRAKAGALRPPLFIRKDTLELSESVAISGQEPRPRYAPAPGAVSGKVVALPSPADPYQLVETTLPIESAMNGSPVFDAGGRVTGIVFSRPVVPSPIVRNEGGETAPTFVIPAARIWELLLSSGVEIPSRATSLAPSAAELALISRAGTAQVECWK